MEAPIGIWAAAVAVIVGMLAVTRLIEEVPNHAVSR
jgi:hypothetical protein